MVLQKRARVTFLGLDSQFLTPTPVPEEGFFLWCRRNEPTYGTPRKSQILTYLEQNEGPGLQHLALKTDDIFSTLRQIRARSSQGGFDFMPYVPQPPVFGCMARETVLEPCHVPIPPHVLDLGI